MTKTVKTMGLIRLGLFLALAVWGAAIVDKVYARCYTLNDFVNDLKLFSEAQGLLNMRWNVTTWTPPILERLWECDHGVWWKTLQLRPVVEGLGYSRTPIFRTNSVEAFVMFWPPGVESPVHDHPDGGCTFLVLNGTLQQRVFRLSAHKDKPLEETGMHLVTAGGISSMKGRSGIHAIKCVSEIPAISLHVYAPPDFYDLTVKGVPHRRLYPW